MGELHQETPYDIAESEHARQNQKIKAPSQQRSILQICGLERRVLNDSGLVLLLAWSCFRIHWWFLLSGPAVIQQRAVVPARYP